MKKYELLLVLPGTLDDNESARRSEEVLATIKATDAAATMQALGKTRLAYPVKQIRYGYFYTIIFSAETAAIKDIQNKLNLAGDLLRAIVCEFNAKVNPAQKFSLVMNLVSEQPLEGRIERPTTSSTPATHVEPVVVVDMKEIDKKLDEIIDGDIIPGV